MNKRTGRGLRGFLATGLLWMAAWVALPAQAHTEGAVPTGRGDVVALAAGSNHACGIRSNGKAECWGYVQPDQPAPTEPLFALSANDQLTCGLRGDGSAVCWGRSFSQVLDVPPGMFTALTVGIDHGCGLRAWGSVECWGSNGLGEATPPPGKFIALSAGDAHTCGLRDDGTAVCWGANWEHQLEAPAGAFTAISAGKGHSCGLRATGQIECWGSNTSGESTPPAETFTAIDLAGSQSCGLRTDGSVQCWGSWNPFTIAGPFIDVSAGRDLGCGLTVDGQVRCWNPNGVDSFSPPPDRRFGFGALDAGYMHTCQVRADGKLACWGMGASANSPASFTEIGAGEQFDCARDDYGLVQCWGNNDHQQLQVPAEPLHNLALGSAHACAVKSVGGQAACWGWNSNNQTLAPSGTFKNLGAGLVHSCGVSDGGAGTCWGYNGDGQTAVPELWNDVRWLAIQAGAYKSCGLSSDNFITCWGRSDALPPTGYFRALSVGNNHSCAIRTDGRLTCWGMNWSGQADAPEGTYVAVTAGEMHSCAIRSDGARVCWGDSSSVPNLHLEPGTLPSVRLHDGFNTSFQLMSASNYDPMGERFAIAAGTLTEGLQLDEHGLLFGPAMQAGRFPITIEGRDDNGFVATRDYVIVIDDTPPLIQPMVAGPLGDNGWYVGDVSVDWSIIDPESELVWTTGCEHQDIRFDAPDLQIRCMADSTGGHAEQMVEIKRDASAPHTHLNSATTQAGTAHFEFDGDDGLSGLAGFECSLDGVAFTACVSPLTLNVNSGAHEFKVRAVDAAGNRDPWPVPYPWQADATPPVIDAMVHGDQRRGEGWYTSDVAIDWTVFDPESPVTSTTGCERSTLATDSIGAGFTCTATSNGGTSSKTVTVKRDATAPVIVAAATTAPNAAGWYNQGVDVVFSCSDATSGVAFCDNRTQQLDGEGTLASTPQVALDVAGNDAVTNVVTVKIDHTAPTLVPAVSASTLLLNGAATVAANASDALSGIATQFCGSLATGSIGNKTVDCTATDRAGNAASGSAGYRVVYGFSGFNAPVQNPPVLNVFKAGRSIPLRWRVVDAQGAPVTNLATASVTATAISCPSATENRISTYGGSNGQLHSTQFKFN